VKVLSCFAIFAHFAPLREAALSVHELIRRFSALKAPGRIKEEHPNKCSKRVKPTVFDGSSPSGGETLVVLICQRKQAGDNYGADGATGLPAFKAAESEGMIE
jgi:hypothetical protein